MSVAAAIEETRRHLVGLHVGVFKTLASSVTSGATTVTVAPDTLGITRGAQLSLDEEILLVTDVNEATSVVTVARGYLGSTPAAHAAGALVEVNARFPTYMILDALRSEIRSWPSTIFTTDSVTIPALTETPVDTGRGDVLFLLGSDVTDTTVRRFPVELVRTTGNDMVQALRPSDRPISVIFAVPPDLSTFTAATDLVADVGLPASALDIPPLGAAARLVLPREVKRTFVEQQGDARVRAEVPPLHSVQTAGVLRAEASRRLSEEELRIRQRWPYSTRYGLGGLL